MVRRGPLTVAALLIPLVCFSWLPAGENPGKPIPFTDVTKPAGLYDALAGIMGHGGAWGDVDGDGRPDLYVGGFCDRPNAEYKPAAGPVPNRLYRNKGDGTFELVKQPLLEFYGRTSGAVFADLDNNGTLELYSANNARAGTKNTQEPQKSAQVRFSNLFRNDKGTFVDISESSGACPETLYSARNIGVFDYDSDGLLDLFVVEDKFIKKPRSTLFRNKGNLVFEDVTREVGLPENLIGLGLAVADLNEDGKPDFFVPLSNKLFLSQPGNKYRDAVELGPVFAWKPLTGEDWPCGAAFCDLNRDGRLDLVLTIHYNKARNKVFLNQGLKDGIPQFKDITQEAGLGDTVPIKAPHCEIQDLDNDGWPDIYTTAAWMDKEGNITPLIYRHLGLRDGLPRFAPSRKIEGEMVYYPAGPSADYNGDGKLDLFLINWFQGNHSRLLRNDSPARKWLDVQVVGKKMNRMGIGAQVKVFKAGQLGKVSGLLGFQEVTTGYGYASGQPAICHFGLGDEATVDVLVKLPNGRKHAFIAVKADRKLTVEEP